MEDLQKQDANMLAARKQLSEDQNKQFSVMLDGVSQSANGVVSTYHKVAGELQSATESAMSKSVQAAQQLAGKMDEVTQLAAGIKDLLNIEKSIEKSMAGISSSEDFRKTLEDLRKHINSTTEFCNRLSKPRVITLREEAG
jgi:phage-related tail fiber protein